MKSEAEEEKKRHTQTTINYTPSHQTVWNNLKILFLKEKKGVGKGVNFARYSTIDPQIFRNKKNGRKKCETIKREYA